MTYQHITLDRRGPIAYVTFNRPAVANALSYDHLAEIEHCALGFRDDAETRVVIFTGAGKHFSSGADLSEMLAGSADPLVLKRRRWRIGERTLHALLGIDQITIGAWNGGALGGGACLATATDFRIGNRDCFIQYPEIDVGLNLMWQSLPLTMRLVGPTRAKRLVIGGERIHAETLLAWGLLEEIVDSEGLIDRATTFAETYVNKSPVAAQMIKRSINQIGGALDRAFMHMDADQNLLTFTGKDQKIASAAYLKRHTPDFSGD